MFIHLNAHSWFSMGQGPSSPDQILAAAVARGFTALACTDTNGVYGAVEFQRAAQEAGVRPILGAHLVHGDEECVALAMDERGWGAICRAITDIHWATQSDSVAPLRLSEQLAPDRTGVAILSTSIPFLGRLVARSGPADVYAELRPGKERHAVLAAARRLGVPPVVTNAAMFAHAEDWARHRLLVAIAENTTLSRVGTSSRLATRDAWLKPEAELARHFPDIPEAIDRAGELADRCRYRIPIGARIVPPRYAEATDALEQLRSLAYEGAARRYGTVAPITRDRLEHELAIIGMKGFADYFLVVKDIIEHGPTHCGRGSVANSIVSYALGITHVEPLGAGLLFERFLNPERMDPPDIDLDFPWDERDHILAWVFRRYP
ncbi:MAG TPA: PHP domain-containing protein, partial [Gemmatimonadales bacterium]|nr:PHP domain-containing protein [Gemmatimonadales bacterium]